MKTKIENIEKYQTIFLGFPTWGMQLPPPLKMPVGQLIEGSLPGGPGEEGLMAVVEVVIDLTLSTAWLGSRQACLAKYR